MIRRISTKWVLTVLAAVVLPFLGFAWYVDSQVAKWNQAYVQYDLLALAGEMADRLDSEVSRHQVDLELWGAMPITEWTIGEYGGEEVAFVAIMRSGFDHFVERTHTWDLILAVNGKGRLVVSNARDADRNELPAEVLKSLHERDFSSEPWFAKAMRGEVALVDHHRSDLLPPRNPAPGSHPENFHVGFAVPVRSQLAPDNVVGVVYGLLNWSHFHQLLRRERPSVPGLRLPDLYRSSYAWLWMSDADTIIGHRDASLYGMRVSEPPVGLPQMVRAARQGEWGMYPPYVFRGVQKTAAFKRCAKPEEGGFGWVLGVGVDDRDIYAMVNELQDLLLKASILVLGLVVAGTVVIARRTTRPILALKEQTQRIAAGDLEARVDVRSRDELGELADSFNRMTHDLAESRSRLIKAEKEAAWREMARQVAHEIKNPLTPISLSVDLLKRAKEEGSPQFDAIFERTVDLVQRQVESMRQIAADFSAFAGNRRPVPEVVDALAVLDEVLALNAAWAGELGVRVEREGGSARVFVDRGDLRRVLINLVSNALEAMTSAGTLSAAVRRLDGPAPGRVEVAIRDTGVGISTEVRKRLFEPYFTTRTHGTGLGLAIARRLIEEMGGSIEIGPAPDGRGTLARIVLPEHRA